MGGVFFGIGIQITGREQIQCGADERRRRGFDRAEQ